jgi:ParB family chromosome partitioning protein
MSLGRGLGALITPTQAGKTKAPVTGKSDEKVWQIPLSDIQPNPTQPRRTFSDAELNELAESIKEHGVLQPILVSEKPDGGYEIIAGERRYRASKLAGRTTIPVIVKQLVEQVKLEVALIENIQRQDLNPIEEAISFKRLCEEFGLTQEQVAEKVGKSRSAIANTMRLLDLPEEIQTALMNKQITSGQGRALLSLPTEKEQLDTFYSMTGKKITVRELEREVAAKKPLGTVRRDPNIVYFETQIRSTLGAQTAISERGGKGSITIQFHSPEELAGIVKKIIEE